MWMLHSFMLAEKKFGGWVHFKEGRKGGQRREVGRAVRHWKFLSKRKPGVLSLALDGLLVTQKLSSILCLVSMEISRFLFKVLGGKMQWVSKVSSSRRQAILLAIITTRKSIDGFPFLSYMGMGLHLTASLAAGTPLRIATFFCLPLDLPLHNQSWSWWLWHDQCEEYH